jgi:predicted enzyme related to lactoylglutathione lyase
MNYLIKSFFLVLLVTGCDITTNKNKSVNDKIKPEQKETIIHDTLPKVTGIGGIFFGSKNPKETREWYGKNLGLAIDDYGSVFEFRNANRPEEINYLRWGTFESGSDLFFPSDKEFMINYRVQNIEELVNKLKENGATIIDKIELLTMGNLITLWTMKGTKLNFGNL